MAYPNSPASFASQNTGDPAAASFINSITSELTAVTGYTTASGIKISHASDAGGSNPVLAVYPKKYNTAGVDSGTSTAPKVAGWYFHFGDAETSGQVDGRENRVALFGYNCAWNDTKVDSFDCNFRDRWETYFDNGGAGVRWLERHIAAYDPVGSSTRYQPLSVIIQTVKASNAAPTGVQVNANCSQFNVLSIDGNTLYFTVDFQGTRAQNGHFYNSTNNKGLHGTSTAAADVAVCVVDNGDNINFGDASYPNASFGTGFKWYVSYPTIRFEVSNTGFGFGKAASAITTGWSVANGSADKVLDVTGDTLAQGLAVLGTLITELIAKGILSA